VGRTVWRRSVRFEEKGDLGQISSWEGFLGLERLSHLLLEGFSCSLFYCGLVANFWRRAHYSLRIHWVGGLDLRAWLRDLSIGTIYPPIYRLESFCKDLKAIFKEVEFLSFLSQLGRIITRSEGFKSSRERNWSCIDLHAAAEGLGGLISLFCCILVSTYYPNKG